MNFNKGKWWILHLGWDNHGCTECGGLQGGHIAQGRFSPQTVGQTPAPASGVPLPFPYSLAFMLLGLFLMIFLNFFFLIPYCSLCFKHLFPEVVPACVRGSAVPCGGSVMEPAGISCAEHRAAPARPHRGHSLCCWSLGTCTLHSSVHQTKHIPTRSHFYLLKFEHFYSSPGNYADVALLSKVREI